MSVLLVMLLLVLLAGVVSTAVVVVGTVLVTRWLAQVLRAGLTRVGLPTQPLATWRPHPSAALSWQPRRAIEWRPGPARDASLLRRELYADVMSACAAVQTGLSARRPVQPLVALCQRLRESAQHLDLDLAVLGEGREALPADARVRVQQVHQCCTRMRHAVVLAGAASAGPQVALLAVELDAQVERLDAWAQAHDELFQGRPVGGPA